MSDETPTTPTEPAPKTPVFPGWWIPIGIGIGVALGASSVFDLGVGIAVGMALGAAIASASYASDKRRHEAEMAARAERAEGDGPDAEDPPTP